MKNFEKLLLGFLLLTHVMALESNSFHSMKTIEITGASSSTDFGSSIRNVGDVNNDGFDDILITDLSGDDFLGTVYVIYGRETNSLSDFQVTKPALDPLTTGFMISGSSYDAAFGKTISGAGDINGDGYDDIIIGEHRKNEYRGAAYVIYGGSKSNIALSTTPLDPLTTGFKMAGIAEENFFGCSVSSAGDINKDGYDDIIVGARYTDGAKGEVYVIYGGPKSSMSNIDFSTTTLDPLTTGFKITGTAYSDYLGWVVSNAGDINKDGYSDILISASNRGVVYVIYGGPKSSMSNIDLSTTVLDPLTTGFMILSTGYCSISSAGDINKDGYDDIVIGIPGRNDVQGVISVIYGGEKSSMSNIDISGPLDPLTTGFRITGQDIGFGGLVSYAGDINKDGYNDIITGTTYYGYDEETDIGAVYVIYGGPKSRLSNIDLSTTALDPLTTGFMMVGSGEKEKIGFSVCVADMNNDGSSDILLGSYYGEQVYLLLGQCQSNCEEETIIEEEKETEKIAAEIFEGTSLAVAALGSGSSLPVNFGLATRILRNIKYMKLTVSDELQESFVSWKMPSEWVSAPDSWSLKYSSKDLPEVFSRYGLESAFLMNFWKPLILSLGGLAVFVIFKVLEISLSKNKKNLIYMISRQVNILGSNFALIQFYGNLDDLILYFTLEMRSTEFETGFRICSFVIAIVLLLVGVVFIFLHLVMLRKGAGLEGGKYENISLIFKDFKDKSFLIQSFLMITLIRSVLSSLIFALLFEYPILQISLQLALDILMLVYLCWKRSFEELFNTLGQIFCEIALLVAHISVLILAKLDEDPSSNSIENLSKCIVIINFILLFGCAALLIINLAKMMYKSFVERRKTPQIISQDPNVFASAKFNRPEQDLDQSHPNLSASHDGLINQSQGRLQSEPIPTKTEANENENIEKETIQQEVSFVEEKPNNENPTEDFDRSNSNIENSEDVNRSTVMLSSIISQAQTQELAFARIAQGSSMRNKFKKKFMAKNQKSIIVKYM